MNIVFLGPPGAGKGTQAEKLARTFNIPHISTGDILREEIKAASELGKLAQSYIDDGNLIPDDVAVGIIKNRLRRPDAAGGYILDGFPRTIPQAEMLEKLLEELDDRLDRVIYLDASIKVVIPRLSGRRVCEKCGKIYHIKNMPPEQEGICDICGGKLSQRPDDRPEAIRQRFEVYREKTADLIGWYDRKGLLSRFDANIDKEETYRELKELFTKLED